MLSLFFSRRIQHKVVQEVYQGRDAGLFQEFNRLPGDGRIGAHRDAKYYAATAQKSSAAIVKVLLLRYRRAHNAGPMPGIEFALELQQIDGVVTRRRDSLPKSEKP